MIEEAKKKINEEMEKRKDEFTKYIGKYLLQQIEVNESAAEKIVTGDKTIQGSLEVMKKEAKKVAVDGCGMLTPEAGLKIVSKYYGFKGIQTEIKVEEVTDPVTQVIKETPKEKAKFEVSIEDLL